MNYLDPSEYLTYGLDATTDASWVLSASAIVDSYCRRATLGVTQYTERVRVTGEFRPVQLSFLPLAVVAPATSAIVSARARYADPRRGSEVPELSWMAAEVFSIPGLWIDLNIADLDVDNGSGVVTLPANCLGWTFTEVEIVYTAGIDPIPDAVKVACAQIVKNAQATPALNVKRGGIDRMQLIYFSDSLVDSNVKALLAPYLAQKVG